MFFLFVKCYQNPADPSLAEWLINRVPRRAPLVFWLSELCGHLHFVARLLGAGDSSQQNRGSA